MTARPQLTEAFQAVWSYGRTPWPALRERQDAALRRLVVHAYQQVRYYRRLFDRHRLHPRHLRGAVDLELVPVTGAEDLRERPLGDLLAVGTDEGALIPAAGTAGLVRRYRTGLEDLLQMVQRARALAALGVQPRDRIAVVGDLDAGEWERHGMALQLLGFGRRRFFGEPFEPGSAAAVAAFAPDVLVGSSAALGRLAAGGRPRALRPRLVIVEGTPPLPRLRARLAEALGSPVRATYGVAADTPLAAECPSTGAFHVADRWALLEVLVDGRPAVPGERGELAVTFLHSYAMPILRHRLGHVATRGGPCACGAPFSTILAPDA